MAWVAWASDSLPVKLQLASAAERAGDRASRVIEVRRISSTLTACETMPFMLAVDLGVRTGLALFGRDGRLVWYRSRNFGSAARLRRGVPGILDDISDLTWLALEGGGPLADIWQHEAVRRGMRVMRFGAEEWREALLYPRQQRTGKSAKHAADELARRVIAWSEAPKPTSLRHDAAEAILIGLWSVKHLGWLKSLPAELKK